MSNASGEIVSRGVTGNVLSLPQVSSTTNAFGQKVITVRSGDVNIAVTLDSSNNILSTQVLTK